MSEETVTISRAEFDRLNERIQRLSSQKSFLQLVNTLMSRLTALPGLDSTISRLLESVLDVLGGTGLIIYYRLENKIHSTDLNGVSQEHAAVTDEHVRQVFEQGAFLELEQDFSETLMQEKIFHSAVTWVIPLTVSDELIGVLKVDGLHIDAKEMRDQLPPFFSFAALILKNEIQNYTQLKAAYDRLQEEDALRRKAEEALHLLNQELEYRVDERTAELEEEIAQRQRAQEELAVHQRKLEELNAGLEVRVADELRKNREKDQVMIHQGRLAAMGEMIANIAHQWRQPLNNLALVLQSLEYLHTSGELDIDALRREIGECMGLIGFMSTTIDDFRLFFKKDKERHLFSINRAVGKAVSLMESSIRSSEISLTLEQSGEFSVEGFSNEYSQAILNIISNAKDVLLERKVPNPAIRITIAAAGDGRSCVAIRDNAGGIGTEVLPRVFEPYFTTKFHSQGTGIGLYMSQAIIVKNMGGEIRVSNEGEGALFEVLL